MSHVYITGTDHLTIKFSSSPTKSTTRLVWGISMLIIYIRDVDLLRPSEGGWAPIVFLLLLILCEIAPIIILMDYSFMTLFEFDKATTREIPLMPGPTEQTGCDNSAQEPLLGDINSIE